MPRIGSAPEGEKTSLDGTENVPLSGSKFTLVSTIAEYIRTLTQTLTNKTLASPTITGAITLPDDVRQTFNPGSNNAGLNVGSIAGDPGSPSNGDLWYDSTANEMTARINGSNVALGAGGAGGVTGPGSSTDNAIVRWDGTGGAAVQDSAITVGDTGIIAFPDNIRQTFNPGANAAGLNVGSIAGDPDTPSNGDLWYDSTANELTGRINGANVALGAGGGSSTSLVSDKKTRTSGDISVTSTTFAVLDTGLNITLTTGARRCLVIVTAAGVNPSGQDIALDVELDSTRLGGTFGICIHGGGSVIPTDNNLSFTIPTDVLSAGSHTWKLMGRVSGGTGSVFASSTAPLTFSVLEYPLKDPS